MPIQQKNKTRDPRAEALKAIKKNWSAQVSTLISRLIEYKKSINGRGSTKIGIQPSRLKDPLPEAVSATLQQLASDFQKIVSDAEGIISAQQNYSATRRKRQPKQPKAPQQPGATAPPAAPTAPEAPTEANPLARLGSFDAEIEKLASNRLTRFWQYLSSVFSRKEYNSQRLGMLSLSADLFYNFLDFENAVLRLGEKNIPSTINKFQNMRNTFIALRKLFENVAKDLAEKAKQEGVVAPVPQQQTEQPVTQEQPSEEKEEVINLDEGDEDDEDPNSIYLDQIKHNINNAKGKGLVKPKDIAEISGMISSYQNESDERTKELWLHQIKEEYSNLVEMMKNKQANALNDKIVKVSHNALTRFLRKQLVKAIPFDKTAAPRLRGAELAAEAKKTIKRLMDVLEKDLSVDEVSILLGEIEKQIAEMGQVVSILNVLYKERFSRGNEGSKDLDFALRRKVRRDLLNGIL